MIDRNRGLPWPVIAERHGLSERQCRNVYADWRDSEKEELLTRDPTEWLFETLARIDSIIGSLGLIAEQADNDAARVGALRSQMVAIQQQASLLVASGLLPRDLRSFLDQHAVERTLHAVIEVVERENVGQGVLEGLLSVLDRHANGRVTVR